MTALENFLTTPVEITIKGKTYKMVFDFNAVAEIEEKTGRNLMSEEGWNDISGKDTGIFFWAVLQAEQPEITLKQARSLMNGRNITTIFDKIKQAWTLAKEEDQPADPQQGQTATPSPEAPNA